MEWGGYKVGHPHKKKKKKKEEEESSSRLLAPGHSPRQTRTRMYVTETRRRRMRGGRMR